MDQTTIGDARLWRLFAEAAIRERWNDIARSAQNLVDELDMRSGDFSPTSVRGLINAVGTGPGRRQPKQRLDSLKRYLAWRKHKAGEEGPWDRAITQITRHLTDLEAEVDDLLDRIGERYGLAPLEPAERVRLAHEMHLRLCEVYMDTLTRYYDRY